MSADTDRYAIDLLRAALHEAVAERDAALADLEAAREALRSAVTLLHIIHTGCDVLGVDEIPAFFPVARAALGES